MGRSAGLSRLIPPGSLLRERSFGLFWGAHAISEAGSRITSVVAPILVYQLTGSALGTGVLAALQAVPYLLFGLFAGAIADRADRRRLMVGCNVLQTIILATVPLAADWLPTRGPHVVTAQLGRDETNVAIDFE